MIIKIVIITIVFCIGAIFLLLYIALYNTRKRKYKEETDQLLAQFEEELVKTQMEVQEQTLQTIASDIHDNIGQLLSLTRLTLSTVNISNNPVKAEEKITSALELLTLSIKELRQLASVLHAENILSAGLESAIKNELKWISRSDKYEVTYNVIGTDNRNIDPKKEVIVFRLIQELLNNVIKHAEATRLKVELIYEHEFMQTSIEDNGTGFDIKEKIKNPSGLGINNLYKRARILSGELILKSEVGNGTIAILKIPYSK
jgi:two-component system NarL family sensor kinase